MQIRFYSEWDKQENGQPQHELAQGTNHQTRILKLWETNKGMLFILSLSILCVFWLSYFLFADIEGQATFMNQKTAGSKQAISVATPESILYTVKPGDTLWGIAGQYYPERTREEAVQMIKEKNRLSGTTIHAGQSILLP
ncbi:LysM peptidoglycan-binding domain-containing protein [Ammoniphilus sp. CFH 90114]|uniref:LysM peptidoglycan-binding domain-containing protein n=1 Tax=Ammoniphilus sp. CFH 90114 TaxID=2493665 RepID=UPI00100DEB63|nr:LysM peptidoglycan-binding domain-containing protein [Ammoniphilus sp. CFH 90114]RXT08150.1 LysM peptidoglycan-binding domain-containing protein [Ammoniphilus sp. CFH 90114]